MKEETRFRIIATIVGIFFPPGAVLMVYGFGRDFLLNCLLVLLGFLPGTIHQICLDNSYWSRRKKVRQGRYPGDRHSWIFSKDAQNGGASDREFERLKVEGKTKKEAKADAKQAKKEEKQAKKQAKKDAKQAEKNGQDPEKALARRSSPNPPRGSSPRRSWSTHRQPEMHEGDRHGRQRTPNAALRPVSQHGSSPQQTQAYAELPDRQPVSQPTGGYNRYADTYDPNQLYGPPRTGIRT